MSEPFNLDALFVETDEAPPFTFVWGGETYEMPLLAAQPFEIQQEIETAGDLEAVRILLGPELMQRLAKSRGADGRKLTIGRAAGLMNEYFRAQGLDRGKSPASSPSSANTAKPSRQTSRSRRAR